MLFFIKFFDILGPPEYCKQIIQQKLKNYFKRNTIFNKIKPKKNAIYRDFLRSLVLTSVIS